MSGKMFDLEQSILDCWRVTNDVELVYDNFDSMSKDEVLNALLGIKQLYELKFNKAWNDFEEMTKSKKKV
jgi:hypothetical protein